MAQVIESGLVQVKSLVHVEIDEGLDDIQAIKQVIKTSNFKRTSIKRIANKTGLKRSIILKLARRSEDIIIGMGKESADHILRLVK